MPDTPETRCFPEAAAGGYPRGDHRMTFVVRVAALVRPGAVVLDFGAGRGKWMEDSVPLRRELGDLRRRGARVVGVDPDPAVLCHPGLDERHVVDPAAPLPLADASIDVIVAFSVLEHVALPEHAARELARVLRPGGWICAWTPNRRGYVGLGARLVPRRLHAALLRRLEPGRNEADSFPPLYRMNTRRALQRLFPPGRFRHCSHMHDGQPFYHLGRAGVMRAWRALFWMIPPPWKGFHMIFIQKIDASS